MSKFKKSSYQNYKIIFCGLSKNCINSIEHNLIFLENFVKYTTLESRIIVVDSDSSDGTKDILKNYSARFSSFHHEDLDGLENIYSNRIERIAISRNKCLEIARSFVNNKDVIYIPLDLDMKLFKYVDLKKFENLILDSIEKENLNGIFPFSKPFYYDIFALRAENWINYNSQFIARRYKKYIKIGSFFINYFLIFKKQITFKEFNKKNVVVKSAFGGIGIYNLKNNLENFKYEVSKSNPQDVSEHIYFNEKINDLTINSKWFVEAPDEHLEFKNLSTKKKIIYFFKSFYFDVFNNFEKNTQNTIFKDLSTILNLLAKYLTSNKKLKNKKIIFATASDESHFKYLIKLVDRFSKFKKKNISDRLIIYDLGLSMEQKDILSNIELVELKVFNFEKYPDFYSWRLKEHNFKLGGFAWKPAILVELADESADYLIWFDSANLFYKNLFLFKLFIEINGFFSFYSSGNIKRWTHESVLKELDIQNNDKFLISKNLTGGIVGFNLRNKNSINFLYKWNELCSNVNYIFPEESNIDNHRHDQALLSILFYQTFNFKLIAHSKFLGISTQNWDNKIIYFYDLRMLKNKKYLNIYYHFLNRSTFGNSRSKLLILFNQDSLSKIPIRLFFSKKIVLFNMEENLNKKNFLKKALTHKIYMSKGFKKELNFKTTNLNSIEFNEKEIIKNIESEYNYFFSE